LLVPFLKEKTFDMTDTINSCIYNLLAARTTHDLDLVCDDGTLSYPKLVAGLVFPCLSTCNTLKFPTQHTLILPDFTVNEVSKLVETILGFSLDSYDVMGQDVADIEGSDNEETNDLSKYLYVEATEVKVPGFESDEDFSPDKPLVCKICYATFKTKSGWRNHKVTHQKFRTKEFACYICYRRFYWDKDCRRHIKNIHGEENFDREESRQAARVNHQKSKTLQQQTSLHQYQQNQYHHFNHKNEFNQQKKLQAQQEHQNFPSSNKSQVFQSNNNVFKMKIELLKSHEKKGINTNAIKDPNSDILMLQDKSTRKVTHGFNNDDDDESISDDDYCQINEDEDSRGKISEDDDKETRDEYYTEKNDYTYEVIKESSMTMEEIKDHMKKVKDDLGELLEEDDSSSDDDIDRNDETFETVDPNLYTDENSCKNADDKSNDGVDVNDGITVSTDSSYQNFSVNENLTVDMFDFILPSEILIQPQSDSDLFRGIKRLKCPNCPRRFLNTRYLEIHQNEHSCPATSDSGQ